MDKTPFWSRFRLVSWLKGNRETRNEQDRRRRMRAGRRTPFESLEERDLFAVVVNQNLANINPDVAAIVITGSGFDPIVSNNTVTFNNSAAGTVTSASPTQLTVQFTVQPDDAGSLTAVVATTTENSGTAVQVATVVPKVTLAWPTWLPTQRRSLFVVTASMKLPATIRLRSPMALREQ